MKKKLLIEFYYSFGSEVELIEKAAFECELEAIREAKERETALFKHRFVNGEKTLKEKLFDPYNKEDE